MFISFICGYFVAGHVYIRCLLTIHLQLKLFSDSCVTASRGCHFIIKQSWHFYEQTVLESWRCFRELKVGCQWTLATLWIDESYVTITLGIDEPVFTATICNNLLYSFNFILMVHWLTIGRMVSLSLSVHAWNACLFVFIFFIFFIFFIIFTQKWYFRVTFVYFFNIMVIQ